MADEKKDKPKEKELSFKDLQKYLLPYVAGSFESGEGSNRGYAGVAMRQFYTKLGVDEDDTLIAQAINTGSINSAIKQYSERFNQVYLTVKVSEVIKFAAEEGYKDIPKDLSEAIKKYQDYRVGDLFKNVEEKKDELGKIVVQALEQLKDGVTQTAREKVIRSVKKSNLEALAAGAKELMKEKPKAA